MVGEVVRDILLKHYVDDALFDGQGGRGVRNGGSDFDEIIKL